MPTPESLLTSFPLLASPVAGGRQHWQTGNASVREVMLNILLTRPGELLMRPEFGAGLDRLLHAPNNLATRRQIRDWVMDSLGRWERRILLDRVEVFEVPLQPSDLRLEIAYRLARSGTPGALAVTVRLEEG